MTNAPRTATPAAFPVTEANGANSGDIGMTLRDYFAARIAQAAYHFIERTDQFDGCAKDAYMMADAMLKARGVK